MVFNNKCKRTSKRQYGVQEESNSQLEMGQM